VAGPLAASVPPTQGVATPGAAARAAAPKDPVVAKVEGKPIHLGEVEMLRDRNRERYRAQTGRDAPKTFDGFFLRAGLEEAVRRRLLELDAASRGMAVSDAAAESLMRQDPFFASSKGGFDAPRFAAYRAQNPAGFALARDEARSVLLSQARLRQLERQFLPSASEVDAVARMKTTRARLHYTLVSEMHFDPELDPTDDELRAYYEKEKASLSSPAQLRVTKALVLSSNPRLARLTADSLLARVRACAPFDSVLHLPDVVASNEEWRKDASTGVLSAYPALAESLLSASPGTVVPRTFAAPEGAALLRIDAARPADTPPLSRVAIDLRARWRAAKIEANEHAAAEKYYAAHPDSFVAPAWSVRYGIVDSTRVKPRAPHEDELKAWYDRHQTEFARLDPNGTGIQMRPLADVRPQAMARWMDEERTRRTRELADGAAAAWARGGNGPADPALAAAGPTWLVEGGALPPGLDAALADSARSWRTAPHGLVVSDPVGYAVVVLQRYDPHGRVPFAAVEPRVRQHVMDEELAADRAKARAWFAEHASEYKTGPGYVVTAVVTPLPATSRVDMPSADIRRYYDEHPAEFSGDAQVHVRHILIATGQHGEVQARALANQVLARVRKGEDFATLASTYSEDPGSKASGGDLGFFRHGQMVPEFDQAAFALTPAHPVSGLVRTQFGFHILKLVERKLGDAQPFEDVRAAIGQKLAVAYADTVARQQAEALLRECRSAADLTRIATARDLESQLANWYDGLPLTGVATIDDLRADAAKVRAGGMFPRVYPYATQGYVVAGLDSIQASRAQTFEQVEGRVLEDWRRVARSRIAESRADRLARDLAAGTPWDKALETVGGEMASGPIAPGQGLPTLGPVPGLDSLLFGPGADTLRTGGWARLASPQGAVFVHLDERLAAPDADYAHTSETIRSTLLNRRIYDYVEDLRRRHPVSVLRPDLKERIPPPSLD